MAFSEGMITVNGVRLYFRRLEHGAEVVLVPNGMSFIETSATWGVRTMILFMERGQMRWPR